MTTWGATSSDWARTGKLLTEIGALVAAVMAIVALTNNEQWVRVSGFAITSAAVLFAMAGVRVQWKANQSEAREERAGLDALLCVPVCEVADVDPEAIGVDRAAQTELTPHGHMAYLPRDVDVTLRQFIDDALEGRGAWFIVVDGVAKTGKSRTLLEGLRNAGSTEPLHLLAPRGARELTELLKRPSQIAVPGRMVLWLNDIEPQVAAGLSFADLTRWRGLYSGGVVVGTHGGKTPETAAEIGETRLASLAGALLNHAQTLPLGKTSAAELARLAASSSPGTRADLANFGLAAYLVAAPQVLSKVVAGLHPGHGSNDWGAALVNAVLDWARCGRTSPLPNELLRRLSTPYRPDCAPSTDEQFAAARKWALLPLAGNVTVVQERDGGVTAFDYAVRVRAAQQPQPDIPSVVWAAAATSAVGEEAEIVGEHAFRTGYLHVAFDAFSAAASSTQPELGRGLQQGRHVGLLGRSEEGGRGLRQGRHPLPRRPRPDFARSRSRPCWQRASRWGCWAGQRRRSRSTTVDTRYRDDPPRLCASRSRALFNKERHVGAAGPDQRRSRYDRVDTRYRDDPPGSARAKSRGPWSTRATGWGCCWSEEVAVYPTEVDTRYRDDPAPTLREQVAEGPAQQRRASRWGCWAGRGCCGLRQVDTRYADPARLCASGSTLVNKGVTLGLLGRSEDEVAVYDEVDTRYRDPDPTLRERSRSPGQQGQPAGAAGPVRGGCRGLRRGRHPLPRRPAPTCASSRGPWSTRASRWGCWAGQERSRSTAGHTRYRDPAPTLREQVAYALFSKGVTLRAAGPVREEVGPTTSRHQPR